MNIMKTRMNIMASVLVIFLSMRVSQRRRNVAIRNGIMIQYIAGVIIRVVKIPTKPKIMKMSKMLLPRILPIIMS